MSVHFHPLKIIDVKKETPDCVSVSFEVPDSLRQDFSYKQGQSLTMRTWINDTEVRRTYSICSSPLDNEWKVAIKKVEGGLFSIFANHQLKVGDIMEVMQPVGKFYTSLDPAQKKNYLAFAAGSGITPVLSLIKTTLATEPLSSFTLVYGNRSRGSIIFFEELEGLKNRYMKRFNLLHVLSRERTDTAINYGRIEQSKLDELDQLISYQGIDDFFLCGPEQMIFTVRDFLIARGIDRNKIHFELFTTPRQAGGTARGAEGLETDNGSQIPRADGGYNIRSPFPASGGLPDTVSPFPASGGTDRAGADAGARSNITVRIDGRSFDFDLPFSSESSVLEAALQQGADLPYACKGGVCCTCKARLLEGSVRMDVHWGLEDEEITQGYILTCQSHPQSEKLVVDFDIK